MSSLGSILGILLSSYLPGEDNTIKNILGIFIGNTMESSIGKCTKYLGDNFFRFLKNTENTVIIDKEEDNPIYKKIEAYIINKYLELINKCRLEPMDGTVVLRLKESEFKKEVTEEFQGHRILMKIDKLTFKDKDTQLDDYKNKILITSKTAKIPIIKKFIESICEFKKDNNILTIYRAITCKGKKKEDGTAYWSEIKTINNKRIDNTILSELNQKELYQDIDWFMNNLSWYNERGLPYKRGYLLYGIPGTGKTSVIKAIASEYNLDIFSIQMDTIKSDSQFILLMTKISEFVGKRKYILALEDLDRSNMFSYRDGNLGFGTFLNELDGVSETFGRILFITANNEGKLYSRDESDALFRPGRVDKKIELGYCEKDQTVKIVKKLTEITLEDSEIGDEKITPAQLIFLIQKYMGRDEELKELIKNSKENGSNNFSKIITNMKDNIQPQKKLSLRRRKNNLKESQKMVKRIKKKIMKIEKGHQNINKLKDDLKKKEEKLEKLKVNMKKKKEREKKKKKKLIEKEKKKKEKEKKKKEKEKKQQDKFAKKRKNTSISSQSNKKAKIISDKNDGEEKKDEYILDEEVI